MKVLGTEDVEGLLAVLVGDTVLDFGTDHHLHTVHEIVHDVVQGRHERSLVDQVKIDLVICRNLNPNIAPDKVKETSDWQGVVKIPHLFTFLSLFHFEK